MWSHWFILLIVRGSYSVRTCRIKDLLIYKIVPDFLAQIKILGPIMGVIFQNGFQSLTIEIWMYLGPGNINPGVISWFHPPPSAWGDLQVFEPKIMGGEILFFPVMGGLRLSGGFPIIMGGLSILIVYHYAISTKVDQKIHVINALKVDEVIMGGFCYPIRIKSFSSSESWVKCEADGNPGYHSCLGGLTLPCLIVGGVY